MSFTQEELQEAVEIIYGNSNGNETRSMLVNSQGAEFLQQAFDNNDAVVGIPGRQLGMQRIRGQRFPLNMLTEGLDENMEQPEFDVDEMEWSEQERQDYQNIVSDSNSYFDQAELQSQMRAQADQQRRDFEEQMTRWHVQGSSDIMLEGIPITGFRDVGSNSVLFIGGPIDKEVRASDHPWYEVAYQEDITDMPVFSDGKYREEKTLVIDENGNSKWIGWASDDPEFNTPRFEVSTFRYKIINVTGVIRGVRCVARYGIPKDWEDAWYDGDHTRSLSEIKEYVLSNNTGVTPLQIGSMFAPIHPIEQHPGWVRNNPVTERQGIIPQIQSANTEGIVINRGNYDGEYRIFNDQHVDQMTEQEQEEARSIGEAFRDLWQGLTSSQQTETDNDNEH